MANSMIFMDFWVFTKFDVSTSIKRRREREREREKKKEIKKGREERE